MTTLPVDQGTFNLIVVCLILMWCTTLWLAFEMGKEVRDD